MSIDPDQPIVIKKVVKGGHGHHGGAWKVAYADFVTAMMAFFLLLWLLNVTTSEEKDKISSYFDPSHPTVSQSESGAGGVMGGLSMSTEGSMATNIQAISNPQPTGRTATNPTPKRRNTAIKKDNKRLKTGAGFGKGGANKDDRLEELKNEKRAKEIEDFLKLKQKIENAIDKSPELQDLVDNVRVEITEEGLQIQLLDQDGNPLFPNGSAKMFSKTRRFLESFSKLIIDYPNELSFRGHTDALPYKGLEGYSNWELSADRANAVRRVILGSGVSESRLHNVIGKADKELLLPDKPSDFQNRRIVIVLLKQELTNPKFFDDVIKRLAEEEEIRREEEKQQGQNKEKDQDKPKDNQSQPLTYEDFEKQFNEDIDLDDDSLFEDEEGSSYDPIKDMNIPPPPPLPEDAFKKTPGKVEFP